MASVLHLGEAFLKQGQVLEVRNGELVAGRNELWPDVDEWENREARKESGRNFVADAREASGSSRRREAVPTAVNSAANPQVASQNLLRRRVARP